MIRRLPILIMIILFSCEKENSDSSIISNEAQMDTEYRIDLNWNENEERLKTGVNIVWSQWEENPLFTFEKYTIKDVTTEQDKFIDDINEAQSTTYQVEFPTGTFYRLCVLAYYFDDNDSYIVSSDSIQFFTQPLSPIINLDVSSSTNIRSITWEPSSDQDIDKLVIYRAEILKEYLDQSYVNAPNLEPSMISDETGEIEDSLITLDSSGDQIGTWRKIYEGTNLDVSYSDLNADETHFDYYYAINVKIEETYNDDETIIANYRYSLIEPGDENDEINLIEEDISLSAETDQDKIIILNWDGYPGNDFYSYEIWRTDIESIDIESLENNGEKLVEITMQSQDFFEDISLVGSEKTFYYFIRVNNNYGDTIESNIVEGDTTL